jgi:beta-1,4-N-acetylglucosaminyltransferase
MVVVLGSGGHTAEMVSILRDIDPGRYFTRTYIASSGDSFAHQKAWELERLIQHKGIFLSTVAGTVTTPLNQNTATIPLHSDTNSDEIMDISDPTPPDTIHPLTGSWHFHTVPRARMIHQSLYTTPFTALWSFIGCLLALRNASRYGTSFPRSIDSSSQRTKLTSTHKISPHYPDVIISNGPATAVMVIYGAMFLRFFYVAPRNSMKVIYVESWARVASLSLSGKILLRTGVCNRFVVQWDTLRNVLRRQGYQVENAGYLVE